MQMLIDLCRYRYRNSLTARNAKPRNKQGLHTLQIRPSLPSLPAPLFTPRKTLPISLSFRFLPLLPAGSSHHPAGITGFPI